MVIKLKRFVYLAVAGMMFAALGAVILPSRLVEAAEITSRSLTLETDSTATTPVGGSTPSGTVDHLFAFTLPTSTAIQSIEFQYCASLTSTDVCSSSLPAGLTTTSATLGTTSSALSGFTLNNSTNGTLYITSSTAYTPAANTALSVQFVGIVNPSATNTTFYVTISTWQQATPGTTLVDEGNVAASTANPIDLNGVMPESLVFCTGATVSETSGVPSCSTATSGTVNFQTVFSPNYTSVATSQMAASTNALNGYQITVLGPTMTSGSSTITAIGATAAAPVNGQDQFGLNLVANTTATNPNCGTSLTCGTAITPASDGTSYFALPATNYATADKYAFAANTTTVVATSGYPSGTTVGTDAQIYTATYVVNVQGLTPAGTYTTTLTYICTPTF